MIVVVWMCSSRNHIYLTAAQLSPLDGVCVSTVVTVPSLLLQSSFIAQVSRDLAVNSHTRSTGRPLSSVQVQTSSTMQLLSTFSLIFGLFMIIQPAEQKVVITEEVLEGHSVSRREVSEDALLFPQDNPTETKLSLRRDLGMQLLKPSPCPKDASYCEGATDYPKDYVQTLLKKKSTLGLTNNVFVEEDVALVDRFNDLDERSLCPSRSQTVYPNKGQSRDGVLEFIVNEENYKQGIKVEVCLNDGNECEIPGSLSLGYSSHCRQKNILRTLVVVNRNVSDVEGFITKPFEFPSCCACKVTMKANRFALDSELVTPAINASNKTG